MRSFLILFVFFLPFSLHAQGPTDKGVTWIGGTASFSSMSSEVVTSTAVALSPSANHFINNSIFLGGAFDWRRVSENGSSSFSLGLGPQVGVAFESEESVSIPYVAGGFRYLSSRSENNGISALSRNGYDLFVAGGFNILARESLGILIEASYHIQSFEQGASLNIFALGIGVVGILGSSDE